MATTTAATDNDGFDFDFDLDTTGSIVPAVKIGGSVESCDLPDIDFADLDENPQPQARNHQSTPANVHQQQHSPDTPENTQYIHSEWTLIQDSREQFPWSFRNIKAHKQPDQSSPKNAGKVNRVILPVEVAALQSGDYSIKGYENLIAIERKSVQDAWGTFGGGRDRFERELQRLTEMVRSGGFAAVIVEGSISACLEADQQKQHQSGKKKFTAASFFRSILAWQQDYPVQWLFCDSRYIAENACYRYLDRFHRKRAEAEKRDRKDQAETDQGKLF